MDGGEPELTTNPGDPSVAPPRPSLGELFERLVDQGEAFIRAEVQLYRAQATRKALSAGLIAGLIGGALVLAQAVTVALLVGILLAIAPSVGTVWATVIVTVAGLALVGLLLAIGSTLISRLIKPDDKP